MRQEAEKEKWKNSYEMEARITVKTKEEHGERTLFNTNLSRPKSMRASFTRPQRTLFAFYLYRVFPIFLRKLQQYNGIEDKNVN